MSKIFKVKMIIMMMLSLSVLPAFASMDKIAQSGFQYLKIDTSPRAAAMGGAFIMMGKDASAVFYNPAGIAEIQSGFDIFASRTQWIADIYYNAFSAVINLDKIDTGLGNLGKIGISFIGADYGDDCIWTEYSYFADEQYIELGKVDLAAHTIGVSYGKSLTDKFIVGGQVKWVYQHLGSNRFADFNPADTSFSNYKTKKNIEYGLAFDFGTIFYTGFHSLRFGMSIRNFSKEFDYRGGESFQLPLTFTIGAAMDITDLFESIGDEHSLVLAIDAEHPRDYSERVKIGCEYWYQNLIALRIGYKTNHDLEGFTAGVGVNYNIEGIDCRIDYSYGVLDIFSSVNRLSFGVSF